MKQSVEAVDRPRHAADRRPHLLDGITVAGPFNPTGVSMTARLGPSRAAGSEGEVDDIIGDGDRIPTQAHTLVRERLPHGARGPHLLSFGQALVVRGEAR